MEGDRWHEVRELKTEATTRQPKYRLKVPRRKETAPRTTSLISWGALWRHMANTTEPSMCGGDAACCQITLATCLGCERAEKRRTIVKLMQKDGRA